MGNTNNKIMTDEQKSNSSVLDYSLESNKNLNSDSLINDNQSDILKDLKNKTTITIENENENEYIESSEFILDGKEEETKIKSFFENMDKNIDNKKEIEIYSKRSKTFDPKILIKKTPRPHPKESNEYISPLKLSIKSYGNVPRWSKNLNAILSDFQKNIIDCKSCNEEDTLDLDDILSFNGETERTTPNAEDLQDLLRCRQKMILFKNCIDDRNVNEYENILNSDYLFEERKEESYNHHSKKNNIWYKHIKQQLLRDKNKSSITHSTRIGSEPFVKTYDSISKEDNNKEHGLFILGVLESAANERKGRYTVNV